MCNLGSSLSGRVEHNADIETGGYITPGHGHSSVHREMRRISAWVVAAAVLASAAAMDEEMAELAKMVHDNCGEETGADLSVVDKVNAGADLAGFPDAKLKCYIKCIMETAGMMTDGEVDVEAVLAMLPDDMRSPDNEAAMRGCGTQRGVDHCDNAFLTHVCWQKANKKDYFLI